MMPGYWLGGKEAYLSTSPRIGLSKHWKSLTYPRQLRGISITREAIAAYRVLVKESRSTCAYLEHLCTKSFIKAFIYLSCLSIGFLRAPECSSSHIISSRERIRLLPRPLSGLPTNPWVLIVSYYLIWLQRWSVANRHCQAWVATCYVLLYIVAKRSGAFKDLVGPSNRYRLCTP